MDNALNRYTKIQRLRELGAPRWIIKKEQVMLAYHRRDLSVDEYVRLIETHVYPLQNGKGYITIPD